jgi:hypothetical protein
MFMTPFTGLHSAPDLRLALAREMTPEQPLAVLHTLEVDHSFRQAPNRHDTGHQSLMKTRKNYGKSATEQTLGPRLAV